MPFVSFEQQAISLLEQILKGVNDMTGEVERLRADVTQLTTVEQSAAALLAGLSQQIRDNLNDPTALAQIASDLESSTSDLAAAVTANTPAQAAPADTSGAASTDTGTATGTTSEPTSDSASSTSDAGSADTSTDTTSSDTAGTADVGDSTSTDTGSTDAGAADGGAAAGGVADPGALDPTVDAGPATDQAADHQADPPA